MAWCTLREDSGFEDLLAASHHQPILLFKHSPRCGTSFSVRRHLEKSSSLASQLIYWVDVIQHRNLARRVASSLAVPHESPQLLLIHRGECVWAEDHHAIHDEEVVRELERYRMPA